ncbi:nitrogenase component 1 [Paenibacillus tepidiphilus]|uniref:nitrogenase component 1 n=1 Tax=Paenibacillus tepidiphilus TaxID=2608683 RepID=UPI00123907DA|nr:nitrogenase component 1 [Paenibacillus tepidiphilus]
MSTYTGSSGGQVFTGRVIERPRYVCALGGAIGTIQSLPRAISILHSSSGCGGNLAGALSGASGYNGGNYCGGHALPSSNVSERDIVFGGEGRLSEQIENTLKVMDGDLYIVVTGCMVEMIGDDVHAVAKRFKGGELPVVAAETVSFKGNSYYGYDIVLETLFKDYVERAPVQDPSTVNLWGIVPMQDVFWKGNLEALKKLLDKLGFRVNTFFGQGETLDNLKHSARSSLNIVVSDCYGIAPARQFEKIHGVPFITVPLPIGDHGTARFLRQVGGALGVASEVIEALIAEEQAVYYSYLERLADVYNDLDFQRYATVVGDANYAQALTRFLADDIGWLPELVIITDVLNGEQEAKVIASFGDYESGLQPEIVYETDASAIEGHINRHWPAPGEGKYGNGFTPGYIVGSAMDRDTAERLKVPLLPVTYPISNRVVLHRAYAGYAGGLTLAEDLLSLVVAHR